MTAKAAEVLKQFRTDPEAGGLLAVLLYGKEIYYFEFRDTPRGEDQAAPSTRLKKERYGNS